jgi:5'-nucleotidase/UDP-sugar diphosphatase
MKKAFAAIALIALIATLGFAAPGDTQIAVIHFNDLHGHALPFADHNVNNVSGLPAITTFIGQTRAQYENTLVLDAGDYDTGRPESDFFNAEPMIVGYNLMQVDASIMGNHEFDKANSVFEAQKALADFPILSANVKTKDGKYLADAPYIIKTFNGVKVGIFGLTTTETRTIGTPDYIKNVTFEDELPVAKAMVAELRGKQKCDVVIAITHMGLYADNKAGSRMIAANVSGIDLIVDGHSHTAIKAPVMEKAPNGKMVPIVQAYQWGLNVGKGVLTVSKDKKTVTFGDWAPTTINDAKAVKNADGTTTITPVGPQFEQNPIVYTTLMEYQYKVDQIMGSQIGVNISAQALNTGNAARKAETALGDLVADAFKWSMRSMNPDFGFVCGGTIRTDLPAKDLILKDVYAILPFDNTMFVVTLKGTEVQGMFDYIATIKQGNGAFPQVSDGVSFTINYDTKACENILIGGKPIDPAKDYVIVTDSYHATGGDGYVVFKKASKAYDASVWMRDIFVDYLKQLPQPVAPAVKGRITIIGTNPM